MSSWSENPTYTDLDEIMTEEATRQVGLTAEQFNKVMYNIAYLKKLYGLYKCEVGTVTVNYVSPGSDFDFDITHRQDSNGTDYLDFTFTVAVAKITATTTTEEVKPTDEPSVTVTPTKLSDNKGYNMAFAYKFPRTRTDCMDDSSTTAVNYTLVDNADCTFSADGITGVTITVPASVTHGFYCGVNIKTGDDEVAISIKNNSSYPIKYLNLGSQISKFEKLAADSVVTLMFECNGANINCYILEASN